jgi:CO/xanthine dehydrogenase Mo-binding subunit
MIGWEDKYPCKDLGNGKIRSVGMALSMQGSGISNLDVGSATLKLNEDGTYMLAIAAADMGTGCDTTLSQIAAECLECSVDDISVAPVDTDSSPYDSGSYASSTAYITGKATEKTALKLREKIIETAAQMLDCSVSDIRFDGKTAVNEKTQAQVTIADIGVRAQSAYNEALQVTESNFSPVSPPPFMVGMVEIELDKETGHVELIDYVAVVDCGTPLNPNLARVQVEGGLAQGIGMALYENIQYTKTGKMINNSFMQYKIPSRVDVGKLRVEFESSYEPTGPFGAKSIGEIVINTPSPAIAHAVANATGLWIKELPITSEKIAMGILEKEMK